MVSVVCGVDDESSPGHSERSSRGAAPGAESKNLPSRTEPYLWHGMMGFGARPTPHRSKPRASWVTRSHRRTLCRPFASQRLSGENTFENFAHFAVNSSLPQGSPRSTLRAQRRPTPRRRRDAKDARSRLGVCCARNPRHRSRRRSIGWVWHTTNTPSFQASGRLGHQKPPPASLPSLCASVSPR